MCDDDDNGGGGGDVGDVDVMAVPTVVAATSAVRVLLRASTVFGLAGVALVFVDAVVDESCAMNDGIVCVVTLGAAVSFADNFRSSVSAIVVVVVVVGVVVLTIVAVVRSFCINWSSIDGEGDGGSEDEDVLTPLAIHSPNEKSAITKTTTAITFIWQ